ncbi:MAG: DUF1232 domain-containing protein [Parvularcula sp.]|nr:DUF1232 domain-containing protein [Parvularcula sp.]
MTACSAPQSTHFFGMLRYFNARNRALYRYATSKWEELRESPEDVDAEVAEVEKNFYQKLLSVAGRLAESVIEDLLEAYLAMRDPDTPLFAKASLAGALLYFITPIDAVTDVLPFGLTDDAAILAAALGHLSAHIKPAHREEAKRRIGDVLARASKKQDGSDAEG